MLFRYLHKDWLLHVLSLFALCLILAGALLANAWVEQAIKRDVEKSLQTALDSAQQGMQLLFQSLKLPALTWSNDQRLREAVEHIVQMPATYDVLKSVPAQQQLRTLFTPYREIPGFRDFFIISRDGTSLASSQDRYLSSRHLLVKQHELLQRAWNGETLISQPMQSDVALIDHAADAVADSPMILSVTPVKDDSGNTLAVLALSIDPDLYLTEIFHNSRFGNSGETYALNSEGLLLSDSRFNQRLVELGLLDSPQHADLKLEIRDPGVDMTRGAIPPLPRQQQPLTRMAASVARQESGSDMNGYRDYRGVPVVGVWAWNKQLGFAIASEVNKEEAFVGLMRGRIIIGVFSALLTLAMIGLWYLFVSVRREISRSAMLESEARQLAEAGQQEAERANQSKSEFLSSMSHELRTPLNSIIGFAQLLTLSSSLSEEQLEQVRHIQAGGNHLLSLINDVLDLAKIDAGKLKFELEPVSSTAIIEECLSFIQPEVEQQGLTLQDRTDADELMILSDQVRLKQALLNLLTNAVKYNRPGGSIIIASEMLDCYWLRIIVSDTGIGIPADKQTDVFQAFNRLGLETSEVDGNGIGLSLSKRLIEEMDGKIGFTSSEARGSSFWLDVPLAKQPEVCAGNEVATPVMLGNELAAIGDKLILYVEDDISNIKLMQSILARFPNINLLTSQTAEDAIQQVKLHSPDLIIMDISLPDMSGDQAVEYLKSCESTMSIPIIGFSADVTDANKQRALAAGCKVFLTKPVNITELIARLKYLLENNDREQVVFVS